MFAVMLIGGVLVYAVYMQDGIGTTLAMGADGILKNIGALGFCRH
jgi:hypothetical protein